jgi:hypothetical protein
LPGVGLAFAQSLRDELLLLFIQHQRVRRGGFMVWGPRPGLPDKMGRPVAAPRFAYLRLTYRVFARQAWNRSEKIEKGEWGSR